MAGFPALDPDDLQIAKACECARAGGSRAHVAAVLGVSVGTVYRWLRRGRTRESEQCTRFAARLSIADAEAERKALDAVSAAFDKSWQAAAWWLERRRGKAWRLPPQSVPEPAETKMSEEEVLEKIRRLTDDGERMGPSGRGS